ncbi:hypothetical protein Tco_1125974 [Tanacetum coccineum]
MKMEILLEPTSNKLLVGDLCDSTRIKLVSTGKKRCYERSHKGVKASANSDIVYFFTSAQDGDPLQDDRRLLDPKLAILRKENSPVWPRTPTQSSLQLPPLWLLNYKKRTSSINAEPVYSASTIIHSESTSGHDALAASTAKADLGKSDPRDSISKQQGIVKGNRNCSFDHIIVGTNPHVLVDKTKSASEWLETILNEPEPEKDASNAERELSFGDDEFITSPDLSSSDDAKKEIKMEDMSKLMSHVEVKFMDLDSPKDDAPIIVQDEDEEEAHTEEVHDEEVHAEQHTKPKGASVPNPLSPKSIKIQELSTQLLLLQILNQKLVKEKEVAKTKAALLKAKPSFLNMEQLTELLVKSLTPELSKLLSSHDFSNSLATELKELPSKFKDITGKIRELKKYAEKLEIKLPGDLKQIPTKLEKFTSTVSGLTTKAKIKTLDALLSLLTKVTEALDKFAQALKFASHKAGDHSVPLAGQAGTHPAKGEKNTRQGEPIKNKEKESMTHKETEEEEESETDSKTEVRLTGFIVESSKKKKLKKFDFVTENGDHVHFTEEQIKEQKRIKESVKGNMAKKEVEIGKEELVDLLGIYVVTDVYKAKIKYDKYYDKMLNRRAQSRITNCDVLTRKGPITLKVYREDVTNEVIRDFKASDLHLAKWREVYKENFVTIEDFGDYTNEILYTVQEIFFRLHQGHGLDDHARTFSSLLLAEVDKRNMNPLKQIGAIEQLRQ